MAEQNGAGGATHDPNEAHQDSWREIFVADSAQGFYGGVPLILRKKAGGEKVEYVEIPANTPLSDVSVWTSSYRGPGNHPAVLGHEMDVAHGPFVQYVDLFPNNMYTLEDDDAGKCVYFDTSTRRFTFTETTTTFLAGFLVDYRARLPGENWGAGYGYKYPNHTVYVGQGSNPVPSGGFELSRGYLIGAPANSRYFYVGSEQVVYHGIQTGGDGTRKLNLLDGSNAIVKTLNEGQWACYRCTSVGENTYTSEWEEITDIPLWLARIDVDLNQFRNRFIKESIATSQKLKHKLIASTVGMKKAWTLESDAPASTSSDENGYLTIGGARAGDTVLITAKDDEDNERESALLPLTDSALTLSLLDNYVNVQSDRNIVGNHTDYRVRVTHVATGSPAATFTIKVWGMSA